MGETALNTDAELSWAWGNKVTWVTTNEKICDIKIYPGAWFWTLGVNEYEVWLKVGVFGIYGDVVDIYIEDNDNLGVSDTKGTSWCQFRGQSRHRLGPNGEFLNNDDKTYIGPGGWLDVLDAIEKARR